MKKDWTIQELKDIATWSQERGGNVGQAAKAFLKAEERLKVELVKVAEQTEMWARQLSAEGGKA